LCRQALGLEEHSLHIYELAEVRAVLTFRKVAACSDEEHDIWNFRLTCSLDHATRELELGGIRTTVSASRVLEGSSEARDVIGVVSHDIGVLSGCSERYVRRSIFGREGVVGEEELSGKVAGLAVGGGDTKFAPHH